MAFVVVEGALPLPPPGTLAHPRREITDFITDIRQFSLYVQALQTFYNRGVNDVVSHWQVGGIHGQPYVDWNGTPSVNGRGYCVHRSALFPTWHRPYVVLFEQEIQRIARTLAETYTYDRPLWEAAAASLRQPYWGWDNIATVVPPEAITTLANVQIQQPNNPALVAVPNPFLGYNYPAGANAVFNPPFNGWPRTVRHPDGAGNSQPLQLGDALQAIGPQIVANTQNLFLLLTWDTFTLGGAANTGLEGIHDTIHVTTGRGGNMSSVATAAFDPIFFLHHAQVDRVIERWRNVHNLWTPNAANLLPFRSGQAAYWQSPQIIDHNDVFNYSYPGLGPAPGGGGGGGGGGGVGAGPAQGAAQGQGQGPAPGAGPGPGASDNSAGASAINNNATLKWSVRVQCLEYEIGGSFSVYIFISNEIPSNHNEWLVHPTFAGTFDVFANENPEQCENCSAHAGDIIKGFVHINGKFLERSKQASLEPDVVVPYLKQHLSWAVTKANGEVVELSKLPSLEVTVICTTLDLPIGAHYPIEGKPKGYPEVTRGRTGGERAT